MQTHLDSSLWWSWLLVPALIFLARILDQTVGTLRLIFVAKGYRHLAPALGFFEVIIWLMAVTQVFRHLTNPVAYIAYGAGFATGNYLGIRIEEWLSLGDAVVRIIPRRSVTELIACLRKEGFGVTVVDAEGASGKVQIVFTIVRRKTLPAVVELINHHNPHAFFTIEDVRAVREGYFGFQPPCPRTPWPWLGRKSK
ncbi:MAG: DUF2179 domain-containing protein [Polyangiaceae bacterium]|nr:DUF2179 domain-containing protein [Polyangiaceae bacterium]